MACHQKLNCLVLFLSRSLVVFNVRISNGRINVLDARALGDPGFLGEARLSLASLALEPNSPPVNLWLPLKVRARCRF